MSPQSIRRICVLCIALIGVSAAIGVEPHGTIDVVRFGIKPANEVDRELQSLLKQRYEAAGREAAAYAALYPGGRVAVSDTCESVRRFATAGVEAAESPDDCVKRCEAALTMAKAIEESVTDKFNNQVEPVQALALANYTRLDVEIKLQRPASADWLGSPGFQATRRIM